MQFRRLGLLSVVGLSASALPALGDITVSSAPSFQATGKVVDPFPVSNTDLLQATGTTYTSTTAADFQKEGVPGLPALIDGHFGTAGDAIIGTGQATAGSGQSITYTLDTIASPLGYDITDINTYSGWSYGRYAQDYNVSVHVVGTPAGDFQKLVQSGAGLTDPSVFYGPAATDTQNYSTQVLLGATTADGIIASGVDEVKFDFFDTNVGASGYSGYRELDVIGTATPEPASLAVLGLFAAGLLTSRRRLHA